MGSCNAHDVIHNEQARIQKICPRGEGGSNLDVNMEVPKYEK